MKPWLIEIILFILFLIGAFGFMLPNEGIPADGPIPCESQYIGTICFFNDTATEANITIGKQHVQVEAASSLCVDIEAGIYQYQARQGRQHWKDEVEVMSCSSTFVSIQPI